jgi:hypothetical protein
MAAFAEVTAHMKGRKIDTLVDFRLIHGAHECVMQFPRFTLP